LANRSGAVEVIASRSIEGLKVAVRDDGAGLADGEVGDGLGTQIVRTLIEGELGGSIQWVNRPKGGTEVTVQIPLELAETTETKPITYITGPV
jgi:two-component sensor histidine kinase